MLKVKVKSTDLKVILSVDIGLGELVFDLQSCVTNLYFQIGDCPPLPEIPIPSLT